MINSLIDNSPNSRDARPEELRPLVDAGADEKAAVGAALDGQLPRASVVVRHEVLGGRGEVIEAVLQNIETSKKVKLGPALNEPEMLLNVPET